MRFSLTLAVLLAIILSFSSMAAAFEVTTYDGYEVVAGRALIVTDPAMPVALLHRNLTLHGFAVDRISTTTGRRIAAAAWLARPDRATVTEAYTLVRFDPSLDVGDMLDRLEKIDGVVEAWPDNVRYASFSPNDPLFDTNQQNLRQIGLEKAWEITLGGKIIVAVLDTGYKLSGLTDGALYQMEGWDFGNDDADPNDTEGHGTHVANTIAAAIDNGIGTAGAAPNVRLLPVKVFPDYSGAAAESDIMDGLNWAVEQGAQVANMSLGGGGYNGMGDSSIRRAFQNDVLVVVASGNSGGEVEYPAAYENSFAVGSCGMHNTGDQPIRSDFSNFGDALDAVAPGENIIAETIGSEGIGFYSAWGTSMAAPHASAVAALVYAAAGGDITAESVFETLTKNANRKPGTDWDVEVGWGEVNASKAVTAITGEIPNEPPSASIYADPFKGKAPLEVTFTAGATDSDGSIERYLWSFSSGEIYNTATFQHTFDKAGEYTIMLSVTDSDGASDSDQVIIMVEGGTTAKKDGGGGCAVSTNADGGILLLLAMGLSLILWRRFAAKTVRF